MEVSVPSGFSVMEVLETGVERVRQQKARKFALTRAVRLGDLLAFAVCYRRVKVDVV